MALAEGPELYRLLVIEKGHFYVCGDCTMAEDVCQTLKRVIKKYGNMKDKEVEAYMNSLRVIITIQFIIKFSYCSLLYHL